MYCACVTLGSCFHFRAYSRVPIYSCLWPQKSVSFVVPMRLSRAQKTIHDRHVRTYNYTQNCHCNYVVRVKHSSLLQHYSTPRLLLESQHYILFIISITYMIVKRGTMSRSTLHKKHILYSKRVRSFNQHTVKYRSQHPTNSTKQIINIIYVLIMKILLWLF